MKKQIEKPLQYDKAALHRKGMKRALQMLLVYSAGLGFIDAALWFGAGPAALSSSGGAGWITLAVINVFGLLQGIAMGYSQGSKPPELPAPPPTAHGSAHWADEEEAQKYRYRSEEQTDPADDPHIRFV